MFVCEPTGFVSSCRHLNFRFRACFEQAVPWHSGNYIVWIRSETRTWHNINMQSRKTVTANGLSNHYVSFKLTVEDIVQLITCRLTNIVHLIWQCECLTQYIEEHGPVFGVGFWGKFAETVFLFTFVVVFLEKIQFHGSVQVFRKWEFSKRKINKILWTIYLYIWISTISSGKKGAGLYVELKMECVSFFSFTTI